MIGTLDEDKKKAWKRELPLLVSAYNKTPHSSTAISPYELFTGRKPRLPVDILMNLPTEEEAATSDTKYVANLKRRIQWAFSVADNATKSRLARDERCQPSRGAAVLRPGDRVLVRNFAPTSKIDIQWKETVHVVVERAPDNCPVYVVRPESGGPEFSLHRNHLLLLAEQMSEPFVSNDWSSSEEEDDPTVDDYDGAGQELVLYEPVPERRPGPTTRAMARASSAILSLPSSVWSAVSSSCWDTSG